MPKQNSGAKPLQVGSYCPHDPRGVVSVLGSGRCIPDSFLRCSAKQFFVVDIEFVERNFVNIFFSTGVLFMALFNSVYCSKCKVWVYSDIPIHVFAFCNY